ncbi:MAG: ROK family transcriptional regulator, partial [Actinomyces sp.]|nr:ROK family transcriptional regulator [Actinomyces sp.]
MHYPTRRPLPTLEDRIVAHLAKAPATRSQLCEALDTSRTNLGRALTTLLDEGSVTPVRTNAPGRGRPTQLLTLNSSAAHCVGLNVTRTSCAGVMLSRAGTVLAAVHIVSPASPSLQLSLEQTCEALAASAARQGINTSTVRAVGVGVPIPMGRNARLSSDAYPTMEELSELTRRWWAPLPIVDNTVRMAALAEALWGAGADMSSFIYLRLSGGVGGCVVSDFRLVGGAGGLAGELGHMTVGAHDSACACGKRGCLETLASVP